MLWPVGMYVCVSFLCACSSFLMKRWLCLRGERVENRDRVWFLAVQNEYGVNSLRCVFFFFSPRHSIIFVPLGLVSFLSMSGWPLHEVSYLLFCQHGEPTLSRVVCDFILIMLQLPENGFWRSHVLISVYAILTSEMWCLLLFQLHFWRIETIDFCFICLKNMLIS